MSYRLFGSYSLVESIYSVSRMKSFADPRNNLAVITDYEKDNCAYHMLYDNQLYIVDEKINKVFKILDNEEL